MASHFKLAPTTHHASVECRRIVFIACCSVNVTPVDAWLLSISAYIFVAFYKREIRKCTNILSLFGSDVFLVGSSATADLLRSYTMTPGGRDCFSSDSSHREIGVVVVRGGRHTITLFRRAGTVHLAAGGHRGRLIGNRRPSVCRRRSATIDGAAKHRRRKSDGSFVRTGPAFALHDRSFRSFARKIDRRHIASLQPLM